MSGLRRLTQENRDPLFDPERLLLTRRARLTRLARLGRWVGYLAFGLAIGMLALGLATNFSDDVAAVVVVLLIGGSVVLAPAILLHYAVRGAEREDTQRKG